MNNSLSSSDPAASVPAHCRACQHRFPAPIAPTAIVLCPQCGSEQVMDHNVEAVGRAHLTVMFDAVAGSVPAGGEWRVERGGRVFSILSDELNEAGDPKVIAVVGEDIASPFDVTENAANAQLLAAAKDMQRTLFAMVVACAIAEEHGRLPEEIGASLVEGARLALVKGGGREVRA